MQTDIHVLCQNTARKSKILVIARFFFVIAGLFFGLLPSVILIFTKKNLAITFKVMAITPYSWSFFRPKSHWYIVLKIPKNSENGTKSKVVANF